MSKSKEILFSVSIDDMEVQTFRSGGPGGQHQNKTDSGVRLIHHPSGARGESREERSQLQNKRKAFLRLAEHPVFVSWLASESRRLNGEKTSEEIVDDMMSRVSDFVIEVKDEDGKWLKV